MVGRVEQVGKIPLLEFCQPEGFGKRSQRHLKEGQGINETNEPPHFQFQDLGAVPHLFNDLLLSMEFVDGRVTVVALKVVGQDSQRARILFGQGLEPLQEINDGGHLQPGLNHKWNFLEPQLTV